MPLEVAKIFDAFAFVDTFIIILFHSFPVRTWSGLTPASARDLECGRLHARAPVWARKVESGSGRGERRGRGVERRLPRERQHSARPSRTNRESQQKQKANGEMREEEPRASARNCSFGKFHDQADNVEKQHY
jgi:hypothetical protein